MTLALTFSWVTLETYGIFQGVLIFIMFVVFNGNQVAVYFKHVGTSYKSERNQKNMQYLGTVAAIWNVSFIIQFLSAYYGQLIL